MHYYQHNIADYRADTSHLSLLEHGIYRQLLDWYYLDEKPIPKETELVFRRLSAKTEDEQKAVLLVLNDFFVFDDGYKHTRCESEIKLYKSKQDRARENGKQGGRPKKTEEVILANQEKTKSKANQELLTNNQCKEKRDKKESAKASPVARPPDVSEQVWDDWQKLRKAKKAPVTETVVKSARREAEKASLSFESFLELWCARGSQGLQADWIKPDERGKPQQLTEHQRREDASARAFFGHRLQSEAIEISEVEGDYAIKFLG
jgi:uncharacterized protein YdaU (DUF1376 family)